MAGIGLAAIICRFPIQVTQCNARIYKFFQNATRKAANFPLDFLAAIRHILLIPFDARDESRP
jgi:hypothetical protein